MIGMQEFFKELDNTGDNLKKYLRDIHIEIMNLKKKILTLGIDKRVGAMTILSMNIFVCVDMIINVIKNMSQDGKEQDVLHELLEEISNKVTMILDDPDLTHEETLNKEKLH